MGRIKRLSIILFITIRVGWVNEKGLESGEKWAMRRLSSTERHVVCMCPSAAIIREAIKRSLVISAYFSTSTAHKTLSALFVLKARRQSKLFFLFLYSEVSILFLTRKVSVLQYVSGPLQFTVMKNSPTKLSSILRMKTEAKVQWALIFYTGTSSEMKLLKPTPLYSLI